MFPRRRFPALATALATGTDDTNFLAKARVFLREHMDRIAIEKLRKNKPLTTTDLPELERMLAASGLGTRRLTLISESDIISYPMVIRTPIRNEQPRALDPHRDLQGPGPIEHRLGRHRIAYASSRCRYHRRPRIASSSGTERSTRNFPPTASAKRDRQGSCQIGARLLNCCGDSAMMEYKGYNAKVDYNDEARLFHGQVLHMRDVITFQGTSVDELRKAFTDSVDDYLDFCQSRGEDPEKPFSGRFLVRIDPALHRRVAIAASGASESLNAWVGRCLERALTPQISLHHAATLPRATAEPTAPEYNKRPRNR